MKARVPNKALSSVLSAKKKLSLFVNGFNEKSRDPRIRILFADKYLGMNPGNFWSDIKTAGGVALEGGVPFPNGKKPLKLITRLIEMICNDHSEAIVVDFYAGSASTAHAVIDHNSENDARIQFVTVQYPEQIDESDDDNKLVIQFCHDNDIPKFVSEISKERIRRAGAKILEENTELKGTLDVGFRVLKIDSSNMKDVRRTAGETSQADLLELVDNIKADRTGEDLLFQVLLNWGVDLTLPINREVLEDKNVYFVDDNALAACFDGGVTDALVKAIAARGPLRAVFRDDAFADDAARINAEQLFTQLSPATELRVI